jgi:hypothetical protein
MSEDKNRKTSDASEPGGDEMSEAEIDKSLAESFPASDPPRGLSVRITARSSKLHRQSNRSGIKRM